MNVPPSLPSPPAVPALRPVPIERESSRRRISPLTLRIMAVNMLALAILVGSLLYLGRYQDRLVGAELDALLLQARMSASALGEGAAVLDREKRTFLSPLLARLMVRRLTESSTARIQLFGVDDSPLADSLSLHKHGEDTPSSPHAAPPALSATARLGFFVQDLVTHGDDKLEAWIAADRLPIYPDDAKEQQNATYAPAREALTGTQATRVWRLPEGGLLLAAAVPVQRYQHILGVVLLSRPDSNVDAAMRAVRLSILQVFALTLIITVGLSIYLARTIVHPLRLLASAAEGIRRNQMKITGLGDKAQRPGSTDLPDFGERHDEIGDLSTALRAMTGALGKRVGAIENFAADVAHELKNPLTSLRSAIETMELVQDDPERRRRLLRLLRDDVDRLDRLLSDIAKASRLDAELIRSEATPIDLGALTRLVVETFGPSDESGDNPSPRVTLAPLPPGSLRVRGVEGRLAQVLQNLLDNALSFSPPGQLVTVSLQREGTRLEILVDDNGPGIPENKRETIFERFYTERPAAEKFGTHSGLGLSIARQIIEAHGGHLSAENRPRPDGTTEGARFIVSLPAASTA